MRRLIATARLQELILKVMIIVSCTLSLSGCLDDFLGETAVPCGGLASCSAPQSCVNNVCVSSCYETNDCPSDSTCRRHLCMPNITKTSEVQLDGGGTDAHVDDMDSTPGLDSDMSSDMSSDMGSDMGDIEPENDAEIPE